MELRDSLILFLSLSGLLQVYYLACMSFPILYSYYPYGFIGHSFFYAAEFVLLFFYVKAVRKASFHDLGFKKSAEWKANCAVGFLFAIFHNAVYLTISILVLGVKHAYMLPIYLQIPVYFAFHLLISVSEEGVFRGCILGRLLQRYRSATSLVFSSALFGLYHINYVGWTLNFTPLTTLFQAAYVFQSFTAGLFLAVLYYKTGRNLLAPVSYHFSQMFFNIPFLWTETPLETQMILSTVSSALNIIQALMLQQLKLKTTKP